MTGRVWIANQITSPLFTTYMYEKLGTQWASSIPAFLSLVFMPLSFVFLKIGPALRARSKLANEAKAQMAKLQEVRQKVEENVEGKYAVNAIDNTGQTSRLSRNWTRVVRNNGAG